MRKTAILTLALSLLSPAGGIDRIDFSKANRMPLESISQSDEKDSAYLSELSIFDIAEILSMKGSQFYPFVANVHKGPEDQPRFNRINNPLYLKPIAVSALIRNQVGKKARHEVRDLSTNEVVGQYEAKVEFSPTILGKEYTPKTLDIANRDYEARWSIEQPAGKQEPYKEIGRMLFGKHGTRTLVR